MQRRVARPDAIYLPNLFHRLDSVDRRTAVVIGAILAYCLLHWAIRLATSPVYTPDEAEQLLMSQSLDVGYRFRHPPLVTWIYVLAERAFGLSRPTFFAVKYVIMAAGLVAFYLAARIAFRTASRDGRHQQADNLAAASLGAWALVYYPAWGHHEDLTHTVLLFTCLSLTLHAFMAALAFGGMRNWFYLGATIGFGFLSKYVHAMLPAALVLAALTMPELRKGAGPAMAKLDRSGLAIAAFVGLAIPAPYFWWIESNGYSLTALAASVTHAEPQAGASTIADILRERGRGLTSLVEALALFSLPLTAIFPVIFCRTWRRAAQAEPAPGNAIERRRNLMWRQLMMRAMLFGSAMYVIAVFFGSESFKPRWMHQVLLPLPIWLFLHVERTGVRAVSMRIYSAVVACFIALVAIGRFIDWNEDVTICQLDKCRAYLPVESWAADLNATDISGGTIVGADYQLSGNLRAFTRAERVVDSAFDVPMRPRRQAGRPSCVAVWRGGAQMPSQLKDYLRRDMQVDVTSSAPEGSFRHFLLKSRNRASTLYYRRLPPSPLCR